MKPIAILSFLILSLLLSCGKKKEVSFSSTSKTITSRDGSLPEDAGDISLPEDPSNVSYKLDNATIQAGVETKLTFKVTPKDSETKFRYQGVVKLIASDVDDRAAISGSEPIDFQLDGSSELPEITFNVILIKAGAATLTLVDSYGQSFDFPVTVTSSELAGFDIIGAPKKINRKAKAGFVVYAVDQFQNTISDFNGTIDVTTDFPLVAELDNLVFDPRVDHGSKIVSFVPLVAGSLALKVSDPNTGISKEIEIEVENSDNITNDHQFFFSSGQKAFACLPEEARKSPLPVRLIDLDSNKILAESTTLLDLDNYDKKSSCLVFKGKFRDALTWGVNHLGLYFLDSQTWDINISYEFVITKIEYSTLFPINNLVKSGAVGKKQDAFQLTWTPPFVSKVIGYSSSKAGP